MLLHLSNLTISKNCWWCRNALTPIQLSHVWCINSPLPVKGLINNFSHNTLFSHTCRSRFTSAVVCRPVSVDSTTVSVSVSLWMISFSRLPHRLPQRTQQLLTFSTWSCSSERCLHNNYGYRVKIISEGFHLFSDRVCVTFYQPVLL